MDCGGSDKLGAASCRTASRCRTRAGRCYLLFGLGLGLFLVTQGVGRGVEAMIANAIRMIASAGGALLTIYVFGQLPISAFIAWPGSGKANACSCREPPPRRG